MTRTELTARTQFQCEVESMLGANKTCGQYSVNTNQTLICLSKQIKPLITESRDSESTGVIFLQINTTALSGTRRSSKQ